MGDPPNLGKWLIVTGLGLAAIGMIVWAVGRIGLPLGRLPGDIRVQRDGSSFYFPLATCILVSVALTAIFSVISRLRK